MLPSDVSDINDADSELDVLFEDTLSSELPQLDSDDEYPSEDDSGSSTLAASWSRLAVRRSVVVAHNF